LRVVVTGGTGFIGGALCQALRGAGHEVTVVSRGASRPGQARAPGAVAWDDLAASVEGADAVVNLAGEPIAAGRWTAARKDAIRASRLDATRRVVEAIRAASARPRVLVSGSAIGFYGPHDDEPVDESAEPGRDFLAGVCQAWEREAAVAESLDLRVVRLRIGIVLAPDGGALARMLPPFRAFVGGPIGDGHQWMSWIHRDDVTGMILAALADARWTGAVNATAPHAVTNREFARTLGRALARPAAVPVPAFALRILLGTELAGMLLTGQRVIPAAATARGYRWRYPELTPALRATVR